MLLDGTNWIGHRNTHNVPQCSNDLVIIVIYWLVCSCKQNLKQRGLTSKSVSHFLEKKASQ